jgi:hypothetical protein
MEDEFWRNLKLFGTILRNERSPNRSGLLTALDMGVIMDN